MTQVITPTYTVNQFIEFEFKFSINIIFAIFRLFVISQSSVVRKLEYPAKTTA